MDDAKSASILADSVCRPDHFMWSALRHSAILAQEQPTVGDTELNFNVGGAEFDPEAQRAAEAAGAAAGIISTFVFLIQLAIAVVVIVGLWKVFTKAGKPGWAAIIPIYNMIVLLEIVGRPIWWILLLLIPCVNIVVSAIVFIDLAKSFGKGAGFGIGLWLLGFIFIPILGFGSALLGPRGGPMGLGPFFFFATHRSL